VTERQRLLEALRQSEALYHSLVETLPVHVWRKDLESRFTFGNERFCKLLGHPLHEILGKTDFDFHIPADLARKYQSDDSHVMATTTPLETTEEYVTHDGERRVNHVIKVPLFGADGKIIGTQGIFWDVTDSSPAPGAVGSVRRDAGSPPDPLLDA
jgi:PAS domain S-box-containing protein